MLWLYIFILIAISNGTEGIDGKEGKAANMDCCEFSIGDQCFCSTQIESNCECKAMRSLSTVYWGNEQAVSIYFYDTENEGNIRCSFNHVAVGQEMVCDAGTGNDLFGDSLSFRLKRKDGTLCTGMFDTSCKGNSIIGDVDLECDELVVTGYIGDDGGICDDGSEPCSCLSHSDSYSDSHSDSYSDSKYSFSSIDKKGGHGNGGPLGVANGGKHGGSGSKSSDSHSDSYSDKYSYSSSDSHDGAFKKYEPVQKLSMYLPKKRNYAQRMGRYMRSQHVTTDHEIGSNSAEKKGDGPSIHSAQSSQSAHIAPPVFISSPKNPNVYIPKPSETPYAKYSFYIILVIAIINSLAFIYCLCLRPILIKLRARSIDYDDINNGGFVKPKQIEIVEN